MAVDIKVIGEFPNADFEQGRTSALDNVARIALAAAKASSPVQRTHPGGHLPGTMREAMTSRRLGKGTAIKIGIIGTKSLGFYGRFVEYGHQMVVGRVTSWQRRTKGGSPVALKTRLNAKTGRNSAWKKDRGGLRKVGSVPPHPFFYPTMARMAPVYGDTVIDGLEKCVTMEKVRL